MQGPGLLVLLLAAIAFIVVMTARVRLHPFLVLLLASVGEGLLEGLSSKHIKAMSTPGPTMGAKNLCTVGSSLCFSSSLSTRGAGSMRIIEA